MTSIRCDSEVLGAYAFGALKETEAVAVREHLASCARCRAELAELEEVTNMLDEVPPEAFLEGPPADGDLVLQRTLRQVRTERSGARRREVLRRSMLAAAAVVVSVLAGVTIGRSTAPSGQPQAVPPTPSASAPRVPGTRVGSAVDPATNVRLTASVVPAAGWVRLNASVTGVAAGQKCRMVVVSRDGSREIAGGWVVSAKGEADGTNVDGAAAVAPEDVVAVEVLTTAGERLVSLKI